jgi:very-short-patch-repair endonuclease
VKQSAGTEALERVRGMRRASTPAERSLWGALRGRRLDGLKFRRQVWIETYIVDLLCYEARVIVELDGSQHGEAIDYDRRRDAERATLGYRTLRFWNNDVSGNLDGVLDAIRCACLERLPSPSRAARGPLPLPKGEGL